MRNLAPCVHTRVSATGRQHAEHVARLPRYGRQSLLPAVVFKFQYEPVQIAA